MVEEMMLGSAMESMVRDAYANYVVQTALEYADLETKERMVDHIRPILPSLKNTPHGRRISSKIMAAESLSRSAPLSASITSSPGALNDVTSTDSFAPPRNGNLNSNRRQFGIYGNNIFQNNNASRYNGTGFADTNSLDPSFSSMNLSNPSIRTGVYGNGANSVFNPISQAQPQFASQPNFPAFNHAQGPTYF